MVEKIIFNEVIFENRFFVVENGKNKEIRKKPIKDINGRIAQNSHTFEYSLEDKLTIVLSVLNHHSEQFPFYSNFDLKLIEILQELVKFYNGEERNNLFYTFVSKRDKYSIFNYYLAAFELIFLYSEGYYYRLRFHRKNQTAFDKKYLEVWYPDDFGDNNDDFNPLLILQAKEIKGVKKEFFIEDFKQMKPNFFSKQFIDSLYFTSSKEQSKTLYLF